MSIELALPDLAATERLGAQLAALLRPPLLIGLRGDLGAGKTSLVRAIIQTRLPGTRVKSPTFTLLESYELPDGVLHHLDLYRMESPEQLRQLGLDELLAPDALVLVEWPEQGMGVLPALDLDLELVHVGLARSLRLDGLSALGQGVERSLAQLLSIEGA
jgi:tRNA threonylcarbamoyladenosine biosynthesis protein TsaE